MAQAARPPSWHPPNPSLAGTFRPAPAARRPDTLRRAAQVIGSFPTPREGTAFPQIFLPIAVAVYYGVLLGWSEMGVFLEMILVFLCSGRVLWRLLVRV